MSNVRTNREIISWREDRAFDVPMDVRALPFAQRLGRTSAVSSRYSFKRGIEVTPVRAALFWLENLFRVDVRRLTLVCLALAWLVGHSLIAADATNATNRPSTNAPVRSETNVVALPRTNAPPRAATNSAIRLDYLSFKVIADRNIFDPSRSRRSAWGDGGPERKAVKIESFTLVGTMSYSKGDLAFFDGSESKYRKALKPQDEIAGYKLTSVAANSVKLEKDGKTIEMFLGAQMKKRDDEPWELIASSLNLFSTYKPKAGASADTSASDDEVLKRLLERRKKEAE